LGTAPLTVEFDDLSTGEPTSWAWDFGDGATSAERHPRHTYERAGVYTVALTTANAGGSSTITRLDHITVAPPRLLPVADLAAQPTAGVSPLTVSFEDRTANDPIAWVWDFGDGGISFEQSPVHTYTAPGCYTVILRSTNAGGTDSTIAYGLITVGASATAAFGLSPYQPNPIGSTGTIAYAIPEEGRVRLELIGVEGGRVAILEDGYRGAGEHQVPLGARPRTAGLYFMRLTWEGEVRTRKILLVQ